MTELDALDLIAVRIQRELSTSMLNRIGQPAKHSFGQRHLFFHFFLNTVPCSVA